MAKGGFRGMPGGMNQAAMIKQAQKMQQEMLRMQQEQEAKTFTAKAGGGVRRLRHPLGKQCFCSPEALRGHLWGRRRVWWFGDHAASSMAVQARVGHGARRAARRGDPVGVGSLRHRVPVVLHKAEVTPC